MWILPKTLGIETTDTSITHIENHVLWRTNKDSAKAWKKRNKSFSWLNATFTQSPLNETSVHSWIDLQNSGLRLSDQKANVPSQFAGIDLVKELKDIVQCPYSLRFKDKRVVSWATPTAAEGSKISNNPFSNGQRGLSNDPELRGESDTYGVLSPRWVETLQGLPIGWTLSSWKGAK